MVQSGLERILVVQTSFLGDVVLTTPLLTEIRRQFPSIELLSVLCTPLAKHLLEANPDIDEIITYDKRNHGWGIGRLWNMANILRDRRFSIAISPHKSFRTGLLLFLSGIPNRIGFRQASGSMFYNRLVNREQDRHDVERNLLLLEGLGIDLKNCTKRLRVEVDPISQNNVKRIFESVGFRHHDQTIIFGINPGSIWATKRWSTLGYSNLIRSLKERYLCEVLLFGAPEDHDTIEEIQKKSGYLAFNLAGKINLKELPSALDRCDMFITNDSGPMHIAVARDIPVVAIFCATTPDLGFYPFSSNAVVLEKNLHCRPCSSHGGQRCPLGTEDCIHLISADHVIKGVEFLFNSKSKISSNITNSNLPHFIKI